MICCLRCFKPFQGLTRFEAPVLNQSAAPSQRCNPFQGLTRFKAHQNMVEQDHRGVKWVTRLMLGFKSFDAAQSTLVGIELMHMLRKGRIDDRVGHGITAAKQFYSLAA